MIDMQTSLLLLIVWPSILNPVVHFSTQPLIDEIKCPTNIPMPCAFHSISSIVDATHAPTNHQIIWPTSYHHVTILVHRSWHHFLFTVASVHWCQVITQLVLHTCNRSVKPSLVSIFSTLVTWVHVMSRMQWAPSSHVYLWTILMCISHKHILVH